MFDSQTKPTSMFDLVKSLTSAVAKGHPFEDILTADVLVDILNASASSEVFSDLKQRDMNVVFVNPDFDDQDAELIEGTLQVQILIFADNEELLKRLKRPPRPIYGDAGDAHAEG